METCCVDRHAPIKKLKPREIKLITKPWITPELSRMIKTKNKLFVRKKRQPSNENVKLLYSIFRSRDLKKSKKSYYATYFEEHCNTIKKIWVGIRSIVSIKKSTKTYITQLTINNKVIDVPKQVANEVNNFFVNVGPNTEKSVPKVPNISSRKLP